MNSFKRLESSRWSITRDKFPGVIFHITKQHDRHDFYYGLDVSYNDNGVEVDEAMLCARPDFETYYGMVALLAVWCNSMDDEMFLDWSDLIDNRFEEWKVQYGKLQEDEDDIA